MKKLKIVAILFAMLISLCLNAYAEEALAKYTAVFSKIQGENGWYFVKFGDSITELEWNKSGYWGTSPYLCSWEVNTGADGSGVGYKFVAPASGKVRMSGTVEQVNPDCAKGTGVTAGIYHGSDELWRSSTIKYGIADADYDVSCDVEKGDLLYFRVDPGANNHYDWTVWFPTVEYTEINYEDLAVYCQKKDGVTEVLESTSGEYTADDGKAFISANYVMPSGEYSVVKRFIVPAEGRFRILADVDTTGVYVGKTVATIWQNGKPVWEQMFVDNKKGVLDVRVFGQVGDILEIEINADNPKDGEYIKWSCDFGEYVGTLPCIATGSEGYVREVTKEISLTSLFANKQGKKGAEFYSIKNDMKYPMTFNSDYYRWEQNIPNRSFVTPVLQYDETKGYVSELKISPGYLTDSVIEYTAPQSGFLWITGDINLDVNSDGVVAAIDLNGERIWSNRVGGERSVRWDEPYDTSYFLNKVDVVTYVNEGDKLAFSFNQWRKTNNDAVNISGIKMKYFEGGVLSDTTKWKLKKSIVVDTEKKCFYKNGVKNPLDMYIEEGVSYISGKAVCEIFGEEAESGAYYPLRETAESNGQNVLWTADRLALVYEGIPLRFGYSEVGEIEAYIKHCENPIIHTEVVDENGNVVKEFVLGKKYFTRVTCNNMTEEDCSVQALLCLYKDERLIRIELSDVIAVPSGEVVTLDNTSPNKVGITTDTDLTEIKLFVWKNVGNAVPVSSVVYVPCAE